MTIKINRRYPISGYAFLSNWDTFEAERGQNKAQDRTNLVKVGYRSAIL